LTAEQIVVQDDDRDFYGKEYWLSHQAQDLGFPNIFERARLDLTERCLHWLRALLRYKLPPAKVLELGSAHGGFVALLRWAGFDAAGLELSQWVVNFARRTFDVPMLLGPVEEQQIEPASLDAIVLMDVLEHLPDPLATMRHCLTLLKPDGLLLIQTPCYPVNTDYETMLATQSPFLPQFKPNEHLYLFSQRSIAALFERLGAEHTAFEPALFAHYDMFVAVSRVPLQPHAAGAIEGALHGPSTQRLVQALLDMELTIAQLRHQLSRTTTLDADIAYLKTAVEHLDRRLKASEDDRAARLEVIERQGAELGRIALLEAQLAASEDDRAARLEVIERQGAELSAIPVLRAELERQRAQIFNYGALRRMVGSDSVRNAPTRALRRLPLLLLRVPQRVANRLAPGARSAHGNHQVLRAPVPAGEQALQLEQPSTGLNQGAVAMPDPAPRVAQAADPFDRLREPKTRAPLEYTPEIIDTIIEGLKAHGVRVVALTLDPAEYQAYFKAAGYTTYYPGYYGFNLPEKTLEHFIAATLLGLGRDDVYIDIASEHSPVPNIYTRQFGCVSYRQDLSYPPGMNVDRIGGDAAAMPVPDGFASKMALHCSFEHFEGDADIRFAREIGRVLRPGGKVCFAPIYLAREYAVLTDPAVAVAEGVVFEDDAVLYCKPGWQNRHGRFYDPAHLVSRIKRNLGNLDLTIYRITNAQAVDPSCYIQFAALVSKP
jgi:SAM-dependent methyltransferase